MIDLSKMVCRHATEEWSNKFSLKKTIIMDSSTLLLVEFFKMTIFDIKQTNIYKIKYFQLETNKRHKKTLKEHHST